MQEALFEVITTGNSLQLVSSVVIGAQVDEFTDLLVRLAEKKIGDATFLPDADDEAQATAALNRLVSLMRLDLRVTD